MLYFVLFNIVLFNIVCTSLLCFDRVNPCCFVVFEGTVQLSWYLLPVGLVI